MNAVVLHDKNEIYAFLRRNVYLHLYSIGDLDNFFWSDTIWYAIRDRREIKAIILLYTAMPEPILLALADDLPPLLELLSAILHLLPPRFYAHLSPGVETILANRFDLEPCGGHDKMALTGPSRLARVDISAVTRVSPADLDEVASLYRVSYAGNTFDPRMLETGQYFGVRKDDALVSIAGVHVYSMTYKVAALGNVAVHPAWRGQGLGRAATAKLCRSLAATVEHIGLNVKADNIAAIRLYEELGFERVAPYGEYRVRLRSCPVKIGVRNYINLRF